MKLRDEITYEGRELIIDTAVIPGGPGCLTVYETMAMWADTHMDIDCKRAHDPNEAEANHAAMLEKWRGAEEFRVKELERAKKPAPLKGKYAKLRDDLKNALAVGVEAVRGLDDGGTCNFDAPAIKLPRWREALVEQAAKEAGTGCWKWESWGYSRFVFTAPNVGQARRREEAAEAMTKYLKELGYDAFCYQAMD